MIDDYGDLTMPARAIFITGASSGIGLASVKRLDDLGFKVYAGVYPGEDTTALDKRQNVTIIPIDITDTEMIASAAGKIAREVGEAGLFGLFNNAGIPMPGPMEFLPMPALRKQLDVNLFGHIEMTQFMLPHLRKAKNARIVNTASILGRVVVPMGGAYSISKYGMEAFSDALRQELRPFGMRVSIVEPGVIATPIWARTVESVDEMLSELPPQALAYYGEGLQQMNATTQREGQKGLPPDAVAQVVVHAFTASRPKIRYVVGKDAKAVALMRRLLPDRAVDWVMRRLYPTQ